MPKGSKLLFLINLVFIIYGFGIYALWFSFASMDSSGSASFDIFIDNLVTEYPFSILYCLLVASHFVFFLVFIYNVFALAYCKKVYCFKASVLFQLLLFPYCLLAVPLSFVEYVGRGKNEL